MRRLGEADGEAFLIILGPIVSVFILKALLDDLWSSDFTRHLYVPMLPSAGNSLHGINSFRLGSSTLKHNGSVRNQTKAFMKASESTNGL